MPGVRMVATLELASAWPSLEMFAFANIGSSAQRPGHLRHCSALNWCDPSVRTRWAGVRKRNACT